jgi:IS5 family transposase
MSLDATGFTDSIKSQSLVMTITDQHPLLKLGNQLPWEDLLLTILPDVQRTVKRWWWVGRPLRLRIHLGVYILQQLYNLTDRQAEYAVQDNAAFRLFCGFGSVKHWHVPDHTKIEAFRSRLLPETQRTLANQLAVHAVRLKYSHPAQFDIDSTVQEANISYPSAANLLVKVALVAKCLVEPLNTVKDAIQETYHVSLKRLKAQLLYYFTLKRQGKIDLSLKMLKSLWRNATGEVLPIINACYRLSPFIKLPKYWNLRRAVEQLQGPGYRLLDLLYQQLFEGIIPKTPVYALHATQIQCFNKNKLNKKKRYGRAYQLGRITGNFVIVGECTSLHMPDAASLPAMIAEHETLFGKNTLNSVSTDKGYYALSNQQLLEDKGLTEIGLPRPQRTLNATPNKTPGEVQEKLHNRRAGIEPLIGHIKHGGQLGRSRMKSDRTTLATGYAAVLGFNLRQLKRYAIGKICLEEGKTALSDEKRYKMSEIAVPLTINSG